MKDATRIGLIGAGAIAQTAHLPVLSKMRGAELVAICDNDRAKARALADRFDVPDTFTDIEDLLTDENVDAVVIATPNHLHEPHVLRALAQHVHSGGELGKLIAIRTGSYHLKRPTDGWRNRRPEAGGGAFLDHGLPQLDLALWLADYPDPGRVWAHWERGRGANAVEDAMVVQVEAANGVVFTFDVNWAYVGEEDRWWFEVLSQRGSARLAPLRVFKELHGRPVDVSPSGASARDSAFIQSYRAELAHFVAVVRGEAEYEAPVDQVKLLRIVEAIYKAAEDGKEIRL